MWPYLIAGAAGALWANSKAPRTRFIKSTVIGAKTGHKWEVEYLEELGAMVVIHGPTRVVFTKSDTGWKYARGKGHPDVVAMARKDFESP